jgi:L-asparaginase
MIRIFVTGGTFDKDYAEMTGSLVFKDTHLPEMLRLGRSRVDVSIRTLMMIDSLEMTDADRSLIIEQCRQATEPRIIITHGTDTMIETAGVLASALGVPGAATASGAALGVPGAATASGAALGVPGAATASGAALGVPLGPATPKTVVLTGAMVPYAFGSSDGLFNLGSALSFVQILPPGVYVAMNGRCFHWDRVRKNRETGVFEALPDAP